MKRETARRGSSGRGLEETSTGPEGGPVDGPEPAPGRQRHSPSYQEAEMAGRI
jgi:hypothetical protein